ncbi:MAG: response regulator transcription factor [Chloroflexota bacterium]
MQALILVIEDEPKITKLARDYLEKNSYRVLTAADGLTGLAMARREKPDLVLLDLMLPGMDGRDVCRTLRAESDVPIIMLTALAEETDQIVGLELGADDYIAKPFSPSVMVARVRAALRRTQGEPVRTAVLRQGDLELNMDSHTLTQNGETVHLTPNEFKLLAALMRHPGQTLSRDQLLDELHGVAVAGVDRSVDSHIKNLRRKLEPTPDSPRLIETVYSIGYRLATPETA